MDTTILLAENKADRDYYSPGRGWSSWCQEEMYRSCVSRETCRQAGLTYNDSWWVIKRLIGWRPSHQFGQCLIVPYFNPDGSPLTFWLDNRFYAGERVQYCRVKPQFPRSVETDGKVKAIKYEAPLGEPPHPYIPPLPILHGAIADPHARLIITEGEKKTLCANEHGFPCIGLPGVSCWHPKGEKDRLYDELEQIEWRGREVVICFDSDRVDNPQIRQQEQALARVLTRRGSRVKIATLPCSRNGAKVGIDDFVVKTKSAWPRDPFNRNSTAGFASETEGHCHA